MTLTAPTKDNRSRTDYKLISADSHLTEPGDLWTSRVDKKYRERVPHMVHLDIDQRIESFHGICRGLDLGPADVSRCENYLPLQVRQRHIVVVGDADRADTRRRQIKQYRCT